MGSGRRGGARRVRILAAAVLALAVVAGCSSGGSGSSNAAPPGTPAPGTTSPPPASGAPNQLYVSIGDSYAAGFQPSAPQQGATTRNGFAYQVVDLAKKKGYDLKLTNFGCGGATTDSLLTQPGCSPDQLGPGAAQYAPATQADAAEEFLKAHRGQVELITVSIGGNDVTACAAVTDPVSCVSAAIASIHTNLTTLVGRLRSSAGPQTRIVGITYPDVILGEYLSTDANRRGLATASVTAFKSLINPMLKATYAAVGGSFADVTAATGAYGSLQQTTDLAPYGRIPVP